MYRAVAAASRSQSSPDDASEDLVLRPEMTASVMRAFLSSSLTRDLPQRWMYAGPMYRHERPQKGRLRQFHQFGVELLGAASAQADVEMMSMAAVFLSSVFQPFSQLSFELHVNSLGDSESRLAYRKTLEEYMRVHESSLSEDSQLRLSRGSVLRILDSKAKCDQDIIEKAPLFPDSLTPAAKERFLSVLDATQDSLKLYGLHDRIRMREDPHLVRGLDYYNHTCFEFTCNSPLLGLSQATVLAGGRYDELSSSLGGPPVPAVGWAAGIERLILLRFPDEVDSSSKLSLFERPPVLVCGKSPEIMSFMSRARTNCFLRHIPVIHTLDDDRLDKALKRANKIGANFVVFPLTNADGVSDGRLAVRDMLVRSQHEFSDTDALLKWSEEKMT
jgi:histidyl-tRNA synthetase